MKHVPLYVGTAGWSVPARYADCFPNEGTQLVRYGAQLNAAEINSSFYRPHRRATYQRWADSVPDGFRFAVKMPKAITHEKRLNDCGVILDRFVDEASGLGEKLGILLVQLPPSLRFQCGVAASFFTAVAARTDVAVACEPRHASWFGGAAEALLGAHHVVRVAADPTPAGGADTAGGWEGLVYLRFHGSPRIYYSDYNAKALAIIRSRLEGFRTQGTPAWCIFDNTAAFHAIGNALAVAR